MRSLENYLKSKDINIQDFEKVIIDYKRKYSQASASTTNKEILSQIIKSMSSPNDWIMGAFGWGDTLAKNLLIKTNQSKSTDWVQIHQEWYKYVKHHKVVVWDNKTVLKPIKNIRSINGNKITISPTTI